MRFINHTNNKISVILVTLIFLLSACDILQPIKTSSEATSSGEASYYANTLHGRPTASGEIYDKNKLTAAHKTLPFQTKVEVKNLKNGKKVIVRINDRMPANSKRSIDLSEAAAKQINMIADGVVNVSIRIVK